MSTVTKQIKLVKSFPGLLFKIFTVNIYDAENPDMAHFIIKTVMGNEKLFMVKDDLNHTKEDSIFQVLTNEIPFGYIEVFTGRLESIIPQLDRIDKFNEMKYANRGQNEIKFILDNNVYDENGYIKFNEFVLYIHDEDFTKYDNLMTHGITNGITQIE